MHCSLRQETYFPHQFNGNTVYSHEGIKLNPASTSDSVCIGGEVLHIPWCFEYATVTENGISSRCMSPKDHSVPFVIF